MLLTLTFSHCDGVHEIQCFATSYSMANWLSKAEDEIHELREWQQRRHDEDRSRGSLRKRLKTKAQVRSVGGLPKGRICIRRRRKEPQVVGMRIAWE
jgi:hypothetical protein